MAQLYKQGREHIFVELPRYFESWESRVEPPGSRDTSWKLC
jgi:hypothetical protein